MALANEEAFKKLKPEMIKVEDFKKLKPKMNQIRENSKALHKQGVHFWAGEGPLTKRDKFIAQISTSPKALSAVINVSFILGFVSASILASVIITIAVLI